MKLAAYAVLAGLGIGLSGCISIIKGTSQNISVVTNPGGAMCVLERQGVEIARVTNTPSVVKIQKTKYDITVKCNKPGYQEAYYLNHSGVDAAIAANVAADIILTAGLSSIVDSATGADNKYDSAVNLTLVPVSEGAASLPVSDR